MKKEVIWPNYIYSCNKYVVVIIQWHQELDLHHISSNLPIQSSQTYKPYFSSSAITLLQVYVLITIFHMLDLLVLEYIRKF